MSYLEATGINLEKLEKKDIALVQNNDMEYKMGTRHAKVASTIMDYETPMENSHLKIAFYVPF